MDEDTEIRPSVKINRNGPKCFLLGASWSHHVSWPRRVTHVYLGPWVLTVTTHPDVAGVSR